jgi:hypothetical protein
MRKAAVVVSFEVLPTICPKGLGKITKAISGDGHTYGVSQTLNKFGYLFVYLFTYLSDLLFMAHLMTLTVAQII